MIKAVLCSGVLAKQKKQHAAELAAERAVVADLKLQRIRLANQLADAREANETQQQRLQTKEREVEAAVARAVRAEEELARLKVANKRLEAEKDAADKAANEALEQLSPRNRRGGSVLSALFTPSPSLFDLSPASQAHHAEHSEQSLGAFSEALVSTVMA